MRLPIFQLCYTFNDSELGLSFASDTENDTQNIFFAIPIPKYQLANFIINSNSPSLAFFLEFNERDKYYFPCEIEGEKIDLVGEIERNRFGNNLIIKFTLENNDTISFSIDHLSASHITKGIRNIYSSYHGKFQNHIFSDFVFVPLLPMDLQKMNSFYYEKQGILVGYTPEFGQFPFNNF